LWYKQVTRPDDGLRYYAYMLLYVDDCLCIHHDAENALYELDKGRLVIQIFILDPK